MESHASDTGPEVPRDTGPEVPRDTGPEVPRDTGPVEHYSDEMGRKDLTMASSVMVVLIVAAIVVALVWG